MSMIELTGPELELEPEAELAGVALAAWELDGLGAWVLETLLVGLVAATDEVTALLVGWTVLDA